MRRILSIVLCAVLILAATVLPVTAQDDTVTHVVQPGENLFRIALAYGVSVDTLIAANHIADPGLIVTGQTLVIPISRPPVSSGRPPLVAASEPPDLGLIGVSIDRVPPASGDAITPDLGIISTSGTLAQFEQLALSIPAETPLEAGTTSSDAASMPQDSGTVPPDAPEVSTRPVPQDSVADASLLSPDLGIIAPGAADWLLRLSVVSTGGPALRDIYQRGQALGNNPRAFSKIGDCNSEPPFFLAKFDSGEYDLGPYGYLQPVIDQFAGSFARKSMTAWTGNHAWALFDPIWSNPAYCQPGETPIECEFRLNRPSVVLIRLGTNEVRSPALFEENLRKIVEFSIERGVIPILGTKADRLEGDDSINEIIRRTASDYGVPLWDFGRAADMLPGRGLSEDGFHMTYFPPQYGDSRALESGHAVQNLTALMALDAVWRDGMRG